MGGFIENRNFPTLTLSNIQTNPVQQTNKPCQRNKQTKLVQQKFGFLVPFLFNKYRVLFHKWFCCFLQNFIYSPLNLPFSKVAVHLVLNRQQRMFNMGSWDMEKASIF